jgi:hypothetical protein
MDAAHLLLVDHLERIAVGRAALLLHLDDEQPHAATQDQVELVPPHTRIRLEEAVPAKPVVEKGAALAAVHAASTAA